MQARVFPLLQFEGAVGLEDGLEFSVQTEVSKIVWTWIRWIRLINVIHFCKIEVEVYMVV